MGNVLDEDQKRELSAEGKNVVVIGGGDTGCDCIATSLRQVNYIHYNARRGDQCGRRFHGW